MRFNQCPGHSCPGAGCLCQEPGAHWESLSGILAQHSYSNRQSAIAMARAGGWGAEQGEAVRGLGEQLGAGPPIPHLHPRTPFPAWGGVCLTQPRLGERGRPWTQPGTSADSLAISTLPPAPLPPGSLWDGAEGAR